MPSKNQMKPYPLRMPDEMRNKLNHIAIDQGRSLHAEIMFRLQESLSADDRELEPSSDDEAISAIEKAVAQLKKARGLS